MAFAAAVACIPYKCANADLSGLIELFMELKLYKTASLVK
jgi:hypothetical protein